MFKIFARTGAFVSVLFLVSTHALPPESLDKPFNEVTFVMTHNSASLRTNETKMGNVMRAIIKPLDNFATKKVYNQARNAIQKVTITDPNIVADQQQSIEKQLADGVRAFKIPMHIRENEATKLWSCHTLMERQVDDIIKDADDKLHNFLPVKWLREKLLSPIYAIRKDRCMLDSTHKPMIEIFNTINKWLNQNPQEIFSMYLDVGLTGDQRKQYGPMVKKMLEDSGLMTKMYVHNPGEPWPTIRQMIDSNKRFFMYTDNNDWNSFGLYKQDNIGFGTNYEYKSIEKLAEDSNTPKIDWGKPDQNNIFIIDNYITGAVSGNVLEAKKANEYRTLKNRINNYEKLAQRPVTFIMVDFYDEPSKDVIKLADDLNKISTEQRIGGKAATEPANALDKMAAAA